MTNNQSKSDLIKELHELQFKMIRMFKKVCTPPFNLDLSPIQLFTLLFIDENNSPTVTDIAEFNKVSLPTQTQQIDKLADQGYVSRINDPSDRRIIRLEITKKGKQIMNEVHNQRLTTMTTLLDILTEKELSDFNKAVKKVIVKLEGKYGSI